MGRFVDDALARFGYVAPTSAEDAGSEVLDETELQRRLLDELTRLNDSLAVTDRLAVMEQTVNRLGEMLLALSDLLARPRVRTIERDDSGRAVRAIETVGAPGVV